jgi:hypothetical protein
VPCRAVPSVCCQSAVQWTRSPFSTQQTFLTSLKSLHFNNAVQSHLILGVAAVRPLWVISTRSWVQIIAISRDAKLKYTSFINADPTKLCFVAIRVLLNDAISTVA